MAIGVLSGCSADPGEGEELQLATSSQAVQSVWVGFTEQTTTTGVNLLKASSQSRKGKSTGVLRYKLASGAEPSCGVTFISHTYAVTAAHCVPSVDLTLNHTFTVQQFNTTNLNLNVVGQQAQISGAWPNYTRLRKLTSADGYVVNNQTCKIVTRCSNTYGRDANCPFPESIDIALIRCENRAKNVVNWVPVSPNADNGLQQLEIWWFHEVVNLATTANMPYAPYMPNHNWWHYGKYSNDLTQNYHYWHSSADTDRQMLPLISKHTSGNSPYVGLGLTGTTTAKSNIPVCHGTSGSGVFVANKDEFLGVVALFGPTFDGVPLCVSMTDSSAGNGMGYTQRTWAKKLQDSFVLGDRQ